ncbi:hypothetical protein FGIG_01756 [Fasciola gigantica]|uniref:Uncharacterized protein n=1 Tax=Fasciola gigantica TaxID=46835 RepID=A0A504YF41_FASGI|nr:hypothetical protein FGIG_01756 [Fasciola gigantica]
MVYPKTQGHCLEHLELRRQKIPGVKYMRSRLAECMPRVMEDVSTILRRMEGQNSEANLKYKSYIDGRHGFKIYGTHITPCAETCPRINCHHFCLS